MRLPTPSRTSGLKFNLTPMIDVVFNLIIFFLAASHLARSESLEQVQLPEATTSRHEEAERQRRLVVTIKADESYWVGAVRHEPVEIEQMILAEGAAVAGKPNDIEVRIRTDRTVPYRRIEPLLMTCARAGVTKIKFAVTPAE